MADRPTCDSRADRTRFVRRPHPLHPYRRAPRRSIRIVNRLVAVSSSLSVVTTRNPARPSNPRTIAPRSHRSSLVVYTSREDDTGWSGARRIALMSRPPSRPPTHQRSAQAAGFSAQVIVLKPTKSRKMTARVVLAEHSPSCSFLIGKVITVFPLSYRRCHFRYASDRAIYSNDQSGSG